MTNIKYTFETNLIFYFHHFVWPYGCLGGSHCVRVLSQQSCLKRSGDYSDFVCWPFICCHIVCESNHGEKFTFKDLKSKYLKLTFLFHPHQLPDDKIQNRLPQVFVSAKDDWICFTRNYVMSKLQNCPNC